MGTIFAVGVGGGLGALARYYIASWVQPAGVLFDWGIFAVNISGGLLMGMIVEAQMRRMEQGGVTDITVEARAANE